MAKINTSLKSSLNLCFSFRTLAIVRVWIERPESPDPDSYRDSRGST